MIPLYESFYDNIIVFDYKFDPENCLNISWNNEMTTTKTELNK